MAEITAALVKELREKTGAGMMDCKRALTRGRRRHRGRHRLAAQEGPGGRGQEGRPGRRRGPDRRSRCRTTRGALVEVNAETDFVARNETLPGARPPDRGSGARGQGRSRGAEGGQYPATGRTVADELTQAIATIGENMNLRRTAYLEVRQGVVAGYLHNALAPGLGKIGVLVALESDRRDGARWPSSASSSPCTSRRPTRRRSASTSSTLPRSSASGRSSRAGARVGQAREHHREDGRGPDPQVLRGGRAARAGLRDRRATSG